MAHIWFLYYASPKKHELMKSYVQQLRYFREGKTRKGHDKAYLSVLFGCVYDIRVKKEHVGQVIRDLNIDPLMNEYKDKFAYWTSGNMLGFFQKKMKWVRRLIPKIKTPEHIPEERIHPKLPGWGNAYLIGVIDDWINEDGHEVL